MKRSLTSKMFRNQKLCIQHLESIRWKKGVCCPYCFSVRNSVEKSQNRHHCPECNRSFSVTVNTIFHDSKLPLPMWFMAIELIMKSSKEISVRELQESLGVPYKTAWYVAMRIRRAMIDQIKFLKAIISPKS